MRQTVRVSRAFARKTKKPNILDTTDIEMNGSAQRSDHLDRKEVIKILQRRFSARLFPASIKGGQGARDRYLRDEAGRDFWVFLGNDGTHVAEADRIEQARKSGRKDGVLIVGDCRDDGLQLYQGSLHAFLSGTKKLPIDKQNRLHFKITPKGDIMEIKGMPKFYLESLNNFKPEESSDPVDPLTDRLAGLSAEQKKELLDRLMSEEGGAAK